MPRRLLTAEEPLDVRYYTRPDPSPDLAGVPLGGLGTGSLELHSDGSFREWQIFNNWGNNERIDIWEHWPSRDLPGAFLAVRVAGSGAEPFARVLERNPLFGLPGIGRVGLRGRFPIAELDYADPLMPLSLRLQAFGPFIPHDPDSSGTPVACFSFEVANEHEVDLEASLVFSIENPYGSVIRVVDLDGREALSLEGIGPGGDSPSGMCLACLDRHIAWWTGRGEDDEADTRELWRTIVEDAWNPAEAPWGAHRAASIAGHRAALRALVHVPPHQAVEVPFVLTWYFPDHRANGTGDNVGHRYAAQFGSAADVAARAARDYPSLKGRVTSWRDAVYGGTLPEPVTMAAGNVLGLMVKTSWWTRDGRFAQYESFQCPMLDPVHVRAPGSYALATLFPELDQQVLRRFAAHQFPSGRIPEQMEMQVERGALSAGGEEGRELADVAPLYVLMVARYFLLTGDIDFLRELWPSIRGALAYEAAWDRDGDGLPDRVRAWTTYDGWDMGGSPLYVAGLWLASLRAAVDLAAAVGDEGTRRWCEEWIVKAAAAVDAKLWNGEVYSVAATGGAARNCTLVDGLAGLWHCRQLGLAFPLPPDRLSATIDATIRMNGSDSPHGATTCVCRDGTRDASGRVPGDDRFAESVWPPTTWLLASLAVMQGRVDEATALAGKIHGALTGCASGGLWYLPDVIDADTGRPHRAAFTRYLRSGSAWTMLHAMVGFRYDPRGQSLVVLPPGADATLTGPFATARAWGTVASRREEARVTQEIRVGSGSLAIREWTAPVPTGGVPARWRLLWEGMPAPRVEVRRADVILRFEETLTVVEGQPRLWSLEAVPALTPA